MPDAPAALVCVHGAGGGGWEWRVWARVAEAAGFAVVAPDLQPGAAGLAATAYADYLDQVRGWAAAARGRHGRIALVGASLGGLLAAEAAGLADALVLVNPMPPGGLPAEPGTGPLRRWGRDASLAGTRAAVPEADPFTARDVWRRWRDESGRVLAEAHAGRSVAVPGSPCLILASAGDRDVPAALTVALADAWGASLLRLPGSHVAPLLGRGAAGAALAAVEWLKPSLAPR